MIAAKCDLKAITIIQARRDRSPLRPVRTLGTASPMLLLNY